MPAWVTVYVQEVPQALTSEQLKNGISPADWWTLGETFGIEADAVTEFMKSLQWKDQPLSFGQVDQRPVRCYAWTTPERVWIVLTVGYRRSWRLVPTWLMGVQALEGAGSLP
jgi:hypothetical protein